jgi:hypothetical protein
MTKFEKFMRRVDVVLVSKLGMGHGDLPDCAWYDYFEDGLTPSQACESAYVDMLNEDVPAALWYS